MYGSGATPLGACVLEPARARLHERRALLGVAREGSRPQRAAEQARRRARARRSRGRARLPRERRGGAGARRARARPSRPRSARVPAPDPRPTRRRPAATGPARRAARRSPRPSPRTGAPPRHRPLSSHRAHAAHPRPWRAITRRWISAAPPATVLPALARVSAASRPSPTAPAVLNERARAEQAHAHLRGPPHQRRDRELRHRRSGRRRAARRRAARRHAGPSRRAASASPRSRRSSSRSARGPSCGLQVVEHPQHHAHLLARHALVVERAHQHPPAAVQLADELARRAPRRPSRKTSHSTPPPTVVDLAHLDPGRAHVGHQHRYAPVGPRRRPGRCARRGRSSRRSARSRSRSCGPRRRSARRRAARRCAATARSEPASGSEKPWQNTQPAGRDLGQQPLLQLVGGVAEQHVADRLDRQQVARTAAASGSRSAPRRPRVASGSQTACRRAARASAGRSSPRGPSPRSRRASRRRRACPGSGCPARRQARRRAGRRNGRPALRFH